MKIFIASDHAGFELKGRLVDFLKLNGYEVVDMGPEALEPEDDYPDYIGPLAKKVVGESGSFGIAIGGSGQGEAMAANRTEGVRAAEYYGGTLDVVRLAREHNDANILSLGARFISTDQAKQAIELFLSTLFSNEERHVRRIQKLDD